MKNSTIIIIVGVLVIAAIIAVVYYETKVKAPAAIPGKGTTTGGSGVGGILGSLLGSTGVSGLVSSVSGAVQAGSAPSGSSSGSQVTINSSGQVLDGNGNVIGTDDGNGMTYTDLNGNSQSINQ